MFNDVGNVIDVCLLNDVALCDLVSKQGYVLVRNT